MDEIVIQKLQNRFDAPSHTVPGEDIEFRFARELREPLGYAKWERFKDAIQRAITSCKTTGYQPDNHFRAVTKMVRLGSGAEDDGEPFEEKMARLTAELREQFEQSEKLDQMIWANLGDIGYGK